MCKATKIVVRYKNCTEGHTEKVCVAFPEDDRCGNLMEGTEYCANITYGSTKAMGSFKGRTACPTCNPTSLSCQN